MKLAHWLPFRRPAGPRRLPLFALLAAMCSVAAFVPAVVRFAQELSLATGQGSLRSALLEHDGGVALIMALSDDALLLVVARPHAAVGTLLYELRRNRAEMRALV